MTKAAARRMLMAALAKCKKVYMIPSSRFWFPNESMAAIESNIMTIIEQNK